MSVDIDCKDIYNAIDTGVSKMSATGVGNFVKFAWEQIPTSDPCTKDTPLGDSVCSLGTAADSELKKIGLSWKEVAPYCDDILNGCQPTFCSKGVTEKQLNISCSAIQGLITLLFKDPILVAFLKKKTQGKSIDISSEQAICKILLSLGESAPDLATFIINLIKGVKNIPASVSILIDKTKDQITQLLLCMCPGLSKISPSPSPSHVKTDIVNWQVVLYLGLGALGLAVLVSIIVLFTLRSPFIEKIPVFGSIFLLCFIAGLIVCYVNPKGFVKTHTIAGDSWKKGDGKDNAITGQFSGSETLFGITVSTQMTIAEDGMTATMESLCCDGNSCPEHNLLDKCNGISSTVTIDQTKTDAGYALTGSCIDAIKTITTTDGHPVIQGAWLVREGDDIKLQLMLHVCITSSACLSKTLLLSLNRGENIKKC